MEIDWLGPILVEKSKSADVDEVDAFKIALLDTSLHEDMVPRTRRNGSKLVKYQSWLPARVLVFSDIVVNGQNKLAKGVVETSSVKTCKIKISHIWN